MITNFKIFEKYEIFDIKGGTPIDITYGRIANIDEVYALNLSYRELFDSGLWIYITNSQRARAIGPSYTFVDRSGRVIDKNIKSCLGQEIICINDKAGPFGGKPTITEGKLYFVYDYIEKTKRIKIKNDNDQFIHISPDRFSKTDFNANVNKFNL